MKIKKLGYILGCMTLLCSCLQRSITPVDQQNPWVDDYSNFSKMEDYKKWGTYNVHDPSILLIGDTYYAYSTDAILGQNDKEIKDKQLPFGYIQVRKSKDLVNWEYVGWALEEIPQEAKDWVLEHADGEGASNIWAPYILEYQGKLRLYYSVSSFGKQTSYIGLAEATSPEGPWQLKGCVVKTKGGDVMNAIDASVVTNPTTGEQWMHYGSYFGGLHVVQLNPETGLTMKPNDQGILTARRDNPSKNNLEAPEIVYNQELKQYFLFVSYDPLMTTYNVRVGRSDKPQGPFFDYFGKDMREQIDDYPILTYPYRFQNHTGWAGVGHCSVFQDKDGNFYMGHQARLAPENHMMDFHLRQIFWTSDGWPVASPQRYANTPTQKIEDKDLVGEWEIIHIKGDAPERELFAGQILWGENHLAEKEMCLSHTVTFHNDNTLTGDLKGTWSMSKDDKLSIHASETIEGLHLHMGQDWENEKVTILFTGLNAAGESIWGKRVK